MRYKEKETEIIYDCYKLPLISKDIKEDKNAPYWVKLYLANGKLEQCTTFNHDYSLIGDFYDEDGDPVLFFGYGEGYLVKPLAQFEKGYAHFLSAKEFEKKFTRVDSAAIIRNRNAAALRERIENERIFALKAAAHFVETGEGTFNTCAKDNIRLTSEEVFRYSQIKQKSELYDKDLFIKTVFSEVMNYFSDLGFEVGTNNVSIKIYIPEE